MITAALGTGAALLLVGAGFVIAKFHHHTPGRNGPDWALTVAIALALLGGAEAAYAGLGSWVISLLDWARNAFGANGKVAITLLTCVLLLAVAVSVFKRPTKRALWAAFALPLVCASFSAGLFPHVNAALAPLAQHVTTALQSMLGA